MARSTLRAKGQLTLPEEIRAAARLEDGDLFDAEITEEGILLRPRKVIDATQAWFWTSEWQAGEREADADWPMIWSRRSIPTRTSARRCSRSPSRE
ncbi:MAG: AbrB/MazE/SpoVT family DNA-binding domain-containing protein [Acidimicrobiales bacterium]